MTRFGMADHDEMTGTSAWDDWQRARDVQAAINAAIARAARDGLAAANDALRPPPPPPAAAASAMLARPARRLTFTDAGGPQPLRIVDLAAEARRREESRLVADMFVQRARVLLPRDLARFQ